MASSRRLFQLGLAAAAATTAVGVSVYMKDSPWWSSLAPVRFGRAATAVSIHYAMLQCLMMPYTYTGVDCECRL